MDRVLSAALALGRNSLLLLGLLPGLAAANPIFMPGILDMPLFCWFWIAVVVLIAEGILLERFFGLTLKQWVGATITVNLLSTPFGALLRLGGVDVKNLPLVYLYPYLLPLAIVVEAAALPFVLRLWKAPDFQDPPLAGRERSARWKLVGKCVAWSILANLLSYLAILPLIYQGGAEMGR